MASTFEMVTNWIDKWLCCGGTDSEDVLWHVRTVRANPDLLSEECLEFTHDPARRHFSMRQAAVVIVDNEMKPREATSTGVCAEAQASVPRICFGTMDSLPVVDDMFSTCPAYVSCPTLRKCGHVPTALFQQEFRNLRTNRSSTSAPVLRALLSHEECDSLIAEADRLVHAESLATAEAQLPDEEATKVFVKCQDVVEVKQHRRIHRAHRGDYIATVVGEIKNRLGVPKQTEANRLAVRRMANNIMTRHGVRPSHVRATIEVVIAGVFVPDENDLASAKILQSREVASLTREVLNAGPKSVWSRLWRPFDRHLPRSRAPREGSVPT